MASRLCGHPSIGRTLNAVWVSGGWCFSHEWANVSYQPESPEIYGWFVCGSDVPNSQVLKSSLFYPCCSAEALATIVWGFGDLGEFCCSKFFELIII